MREEIYPEDGRPKKWPEIARKKERKNTCLNWFLSLETWPKFENTTSRFGE